MWSCQNSPANCLTSGWWRPTLMVSHAIARAWDGVMDANRQRARATYARVGRARFFRRLKVEPLEERTLLANVAPSFTKGADQTVDEDAGNVTVMGWATNISPGPPQEASQRLAFTVTSDNSDL